jgi:hypothetical protein
MAAATIPGAAGLSVSVDPGGAYDVWVPDLSWHFGGNVGYPLSNISIAGGADRIGSYQEISFDFQSDAPRHAAIRSYGGHRAVLFTVSSTSAAPNSFSFPNWTQFPQNLNHLTFDGIFAPPNFSGFAPDSPWLFFDSAANSFILSPAGNFMVANTSWGPHGELASGISSQIASLTAGCQQRALLVIDKGINRAFDSWGQTLTAFYGKIRPSNDADVSLHQVGYWTDNGASYYYQTAGSLTYERTLAAVKSDFDRQGIGLGYIQLDSWFYPKGANGLWSNNGNGIYQYMAAPALFPDSLAGFQRGIGVPLITHARWIDPSSPYHQQYQMSGNVVTDPNYWNYVAGYLSGSGVVTYEQDWLDDKAQSAFDLTHPEAFLGSMASSMSQANLTIQYCMAAARHFLQSARYSNVTTIRASGDRLTPDRWTHFLYTSRLAGAVGAWPFTDVFMSSETNNLLLAALSAGPVGVGDPVGALSGASLLQAVRQDGVIVKPDVPVAPIDASYGAMAQGVDAPQIASTYTDFGNLRAHYVFAYAPWANHSVSFHSSDLGVTGPVYLYDYFGHTGQVVEPADAINGQIANGALYWIAAPVGPSGMAILGDLGNFVSLGKKRVTALADNGVVHLTVAFAAGENSRLITGYSPLPPAAEAINGSVGPATYDLNSFLFQIPVQPGPDGTATITIRPLDNPQAGISPVFHGAVE